MILLFCSSVNALENNDDNTAQLKKLNRIQAGIIQDQRRKELKLQEELEQKEQELEESQSIHGSNTSDNSNSSSNTGQRTTGSNSVSPEQYIGSNNRNTQDNSSSQMNSKVYVNDDKNLDIIKVPNITDSVQKTNPSQANQSQSAILGDSNQQEIMLGDKKQSNSQIDQLDSDGEPLEIRENVSKFELLQSNIEKAEAKLNDLNNAYMEKKLAFEKLEQLQSQLPKQPEIKDHSLNQLQNQEAQKNVAALQGVLQLEKGVVKEELKTPLEETEKNTKNQPTTLSAAKDLEYNADLQAKLDAAKKDHERVQQELVEKKKENKNLQEQITTLGKDKAGLEKDLLDAKNKAEALTTAQKKKDNELKVLQDKLGEVVKAHEKQIADLKDRKSVV